MNILDLFNQENYFTVNRKFAQKTSLKAAAFFSELVSMYKYHAERDELKENKWVYCTIEKMKEKTTLSRYKQNEAIKTLEENNLISKETKGVPAKRHFKINKNKLYKWVTNKDVRNSQSSMQETNKQECEKPATYSTNELDHINLENNNNEFSTHERKILKILKSINKYPFDFEKDLKHIRKLMTKHPEVDILEEIDKWETWLIDNPLKKKSNPRLQITNWMKNASEGRYNNSNNDDKKVDERTVDYDEIGELMKDG